MSLQESNITAVRENDSNRAVVFLHGFTGSRDDTWDRFPALLGSAIADWDIFTVGYATTLLPDLIGIWSADPDLPILSKMFDTEMRTPPLLRYQSLALVAHSMGGLIVQQVLVENPELAKRVRHVILFGTPSAGLRKAAWMPFWKRQLKNMAEGSSFITELRSEWKNLYGAKRPFNLLVVAGASDQFVPPASSLDPFDMRLQRVVVGDHLNIVKPANADAPSVSLLVSTLAQGAAPDPDSISELRLASERPGTDVPALVQKVQASTSEMPVKVVVDAALALERAGQRSQAIALLEQYKDRDTDIKGTLGGRMKRIWLESDQKEYADRALNLYQDALNRVRTPDQIYYLAINVAFMKFVYGNDIAGAQAMAKLALQHSFPPANDVWKTATVAEAYLYLDRLQDAVQEYRRLLTLEAEPWKHQSSSLQAGRIAAKLGNRALAEQLEGIFTPGARQANRIFVSYSHNDRPWVDRLNAMLAPYLRNAESEVDLWEDTRIKPGELWDPEIKNALQRAGVGVALVSADFLASTYVMEKELPVMIQAAKDGDLQLLWAYISAAGWEETPLKDFQATHDTKTPLDSRTKPEQDAVLKIVAQRVKEAALAATSRFKRQPLVAPAVSSAVGGS